MEDTSKFPNLVSELLIRNWSEEDIKKVVGQNVLRVMTEAEQVMFVYVFVLCFN